MKINFKNNSVSSKQKVFAFLLLIVVIILFIFSRNQSTKSIVKKQLYLRIQAEETIKNSLLFLYNEDLNDTPHYINEKRSENLIEKFKEANSITKNSNLKLISVSLNQKNLYNKLKNKSLHLFYTGEVKMQWENTKTNSKTDIVTKKIDAYILEEDSKYYLQDLILYD